MCCKARRRKIGTMRAAYDCGTGGRNIAPAGSELNTYGSNASQGTGNMSCCFDPRNYNFDDRLARLRPPSPSRSVGIAPAPIWHLHVGLVTRHGVPNDEHDVSSALAWRW